MNWFLQKSEIPGGKTGPKKDLCQNPAKTRFFPEKPEIAVSGTFWRGPKYPLKKESKHENGFHYINVRSTRGGGGGSGRKKTPEKGLRNYAFFPNFFSCKNRISAIIFFFFF
jgi:hypothetical protein